MGVDPNADTIKNSNKTLTSRTGEEPDLHLQGRHKETQDGSRKISDAHQDDSLSSSSTLDSLMPVL